MSKKIMNIGLEDDIKSKAEILAKKENRSLRNFVETIVINYVNSSNNSVQNQLKTDKMSLLENTNHKF